MKVSQLPPHPDPLDAFLRAIEATQRTVEPGSAAAAHLARLAESTGRLKRQAESYEQAWRLVDAVLGRSYRALYDG